MKNLRLKIKNGYGVALTSGHFNADGNLKVFMNFETQYTAPKSPKSFPAWAGIKGWVNVSKGNVAFKQARLPLETKPNPCPLPSGSLLKENEPWLSRRVRELLGENCGNQNQIFNL